MPSPPAALGSLGRRRWGTEMGQGAGGQKGAQSWGTVLVALALWVGAVQLYRSSTRDQITDSQYQLLLSEALLRDHSFALDRYFKPPLDGQRYPGLMAQQPKFQAAPGYPYQIEVLPTPSGTPGSPRIYLWYPNVPSILALPYVAWYRWTGKSVSNDQGEYFATHEAELQLQLAAWLTGLMVALVFLVARTALPIVPAALIGVAFAVASPLWSTASRALWTSTWGGVALLLAVWMLARQAAGQGKLRPVLLGTLCALMYFCRPALAVEVLTLSSWVLWRDRAAAVRMGLTGIAWAAAFVGWSMARTGELLPSYFRHTHLNLDHVAQGFYGSLASPSRGLLVFTPFLPLALWWLARHWRQLPQPSLTLAALVGTLGHAVLLACYPNWWGGHSFGARLMIDTLPLTAVWTANCVAAVLSVRQVPGLRSPNRSTMAPFVLAAISVLFGAWVHFRGVTERKVARWNAWPTSIDENPSRALDWRLPQFMAGLWPQPPPAPHARARMEYRA